jgi:hypothetical protein
MWLLCFIFFNLYLVLFYYLTSPFEFILSIIFLFFIFIFIWSYLLAFSLSTGISVPSISVTDLVLVLLRISEQYFPMFIYSTLKI